MGKGVADYRLVGAEKDSQWIKVLDQASTGNIRTARDLATAQLAAGDSVMTRLYEQVKDDGGRTDEQGRWRSEISQGLDMELCQHPPLPSHQEGTGCCPGGTPLNSSHPYSHQTLCDMNYTIC